MTGDGWDVALVVTFRGMEPPVSTVSSAIVMRNATDLIRALDRQRRERGEQ